MADRVTKKKHIFETADRCGGGKTDRLAALARARTETYRVNLETYQAADRLCRPGQKPVVFVDESSHISDAWAMAALYGKGVWNSRSAPPIKALADYSDAELVMHMIERGYACMKVPADGGPPKALRGE
jgi:hypothetical protein